MLQALNGLIVEVEARHTETVGHRIGVDGESVTRRMPELAVSSSAACTSATFEPSHVLRALGASQERIDGSLRFSLGRFTTADEVERAIRSVVAAVAAERAEGSLPACG